MHAASAKEATAVRANRQKNERGIWDRLPVFIDISRNLAFIKLHPPLFVLHRLQKKLRLLLTHLAVFLGLCLRHLNALLGLIWLFLPGSLYLSG